MDLPYTKARKILNNTIRKTLKDKTILISTNNI